MPDYDPQPMDDPVPAEPRYLYSDEELPIALTSFPTPPQPSNIWWVILSCVAYLAVTQGLMAVVAYLIYASQSGDYLMQNQEFMKTPEFARALGPAVLLAQISGIIGCWIALRAVVGRDWPRKVALRLPSWQHLVLVLLGFPGMYLLAMGVDMVVKQILESVFGKGDLLGMEEMVRIFGSWPLPLALLAVAVGPGLAEELFCRAFLGRGLVGNRGYVRGVIVTSLVFGLLHLLPTQMAYAALIGLVLHTAYILTRSLWIPILLHAINNGLSMVILHLPKEFQEIGEKQPIPIYIFVAAGVLLLAVGWALYQCRARLVSVSADLPAWRPDYPGVEYPPRDSGTIVLRPRPAMLHWAVALGGVLVLLAAIALARATAQ